MYFRALVVDITQYDFKNEFFYEGDYEKGFYNLYCQLILNGLQKNNSYYIRAANRNIKKVDPNDSEQLRLISLKEKLNNKFERQLNKYIYQSGYRYTVNPPVVSIESRPAKTRRLIQLADILMGAVGFHWNDEHIKSNARLGKVDLANYIAGRLGRNSLKFTTNWNDRKLNVFFFDVSKSKYK